MEDQCTEKRLYNGTISILEKIAAKLNMLHALPSCSMDDPLQANTNINSPEMSENTSYLDMNVRAYESYEKSKDTLNPNEYVDIVAKTMPSIDDDNIYDNYVVEQNSDGNEKGVLVPVDAIKIDRKICPFNGLPAAHLTIVQSPKTGWLTMHLRRRRISRNFSLHFKRRYYAGLVMEPNEADVEPYNWWLLMYAGGMSDLKPTVCLPLNQFTVSSNHIHDNNLKQQKIYRLQSKFEMNEKTTRKDGKSLCLLAETPEHCEQWIDLIRQLSAGKRYIENVITATAQIRKLPMLPIAASMKFNDTSMQETDTVDTAKCDNRMDGANTDFNNSDGVYEEPEDYYKNVKVIKSHMPNVPVKKTSQSTVSTLRMDEAAGIYDTPKSPVRATADHNNAGKSTYADELSTLDMNRLRLDEVRTKLTTQIKERTNKNLSYVCSQTQRSDNHQSLDSMASNKYQLSIVRRFTNHLAKMRYSTNPTNLKRKSSNGAADQTVCTPERTTADKMTTNATVETVQKRTHVNNIQPKGNKVHMIINQLEANGQLTLLNSSSNKCNVLLSSA